MGKIYNNIKNIKSTILGLLLIGIATYGMFHLQDFNEYVIGGLFVSGIICILAPDTYINLIEKIIGLKSKNEGN
jgi:hypothetical protein